MTRDEILSLKQRVNIVDVVREKFPLRRSGAQWQALCPFHQEKSPSFYVNEKYQNYHCYGCGAKGDVIAFLMAMDNITFQAALERLARR